MGLKDTLKRVPFLHRLGSYARRRRYELRALPDHLAQRRRKREDGPIRVGFLCQYIPGWAKVSPIYDSMKADERFEPMILCVPDGIANGHDKELVNEPYRYCLEHGYPEAIDTMVAPGEWLDLESLGLTYIFYPRPYNALIPSCYSTHKVRKYCRICYVNYGFMLDEQICRVTLNQDFMADVCYYFAETDFVQKLNQRNNVWLTALGLQKSFLFGAPVLERVFMHQQETSPSWDFSKTSFRVIWTPRWITDKAEGGSNFFTYYKMLPAYAQQKGDWDLLIRPHPLTFPHFVETGEMTADEVEEYKTSCEKLPNVQIDPYGEYMATLWGSDVLISDYSTLIVEYFLTGKPVIFCASNMELKLAEYSQKMLFEGCYVVYNEQELVAALEDLKRGIDPLASKRRQLIDELFGEQKGATERIVEFLAKK